MSEELNQNETTAETPLKSLRLSKPKLHRHPKPKAFRRNLP